MIAPDPRGYDVQEPPQDIDYAYYDEAYFYGAGYRDYDRESPPRKLEYYSRAVERAVRNVDKPRVLDIGCAFGRLLAGLPPYFERVGTDVSTYALEEARRYVSGVEFVQAELPPKSLGRFDAISTFDVLEQVADPRAMLERIASMITPRGEFIAVIPVYGGIFGWAQRFFNDIPTRRHRLARKAWLALISESFDVYDYTGMFRLLLPVGPYVFFPVRLLRGSAPAIMVRARAKASLAQTVYP